MSIFSVIREFRASGYYGGACGNMLAGRNKDALIKIKKALSLKPKSYEKTLYIACLGEVYMRLKQYEIAIPILENALNRMEKEMKTSPKDWQLDEHSKVSEHLQYCRDCSKKYPLLNQQKNSQ